MGLFSNRIDRSSLKRGDHIYCYRNAHVYSHHGIYIGDSQVIHYTRTEEQSGLQKNLGFFKSSSQSKNNYKCKDENCEDSKNNPKKNLGVVKCCLDCFLKGHGLFRFKYGVSDSQFMLNSSGTCTTSPTSGGPEGAVQQAMEMFEKTLGFGEYNLFNNNCESFALYCKTGKSVSFQALSLMNKVNRFKNGLGSNPFSIRNLAKALYNVMVEHKFDMLRHSHNDGLITK